jgi:hypothetical protein
MVVSARFRWAVVRRIGRSEGVEPEVLIGQMADARARGGRAVLGFSDAASVAWV